MSAVATPSTSKKPRARSPVPKSTELPFRGTIKLDVPESDTALPSSEIKAERAFMEGKALAVLMVREGNLRAPGKDASMNACLNASYRDEGANQDNFVAPFLRLIQKEPHLVPGFTAALSSMLAEGMTTADRFVESNAEISYSACTVYRDPEAYEEFNAYTSPSLDEQIATYALEDLSSAPLPSNGNSAAPVAIGPGVLTPSQAISPSATEGDDTAADSAYYRCREAEAVVRAAARESEDLKCQDALWGVANLAEAAAALMELGTNPTPANFQQASNLLSQAATVVELVADRTGDTIYLNDAASTLLQEAHRLVGEAQADAPNV
ncbi:hypothetical protein LJR066_005737 [Acidovorax sp. LjRoot66]|uniref:hypothetical protein n=1 Tax=Acidovorax sp. LjRoot66 TaxID=3342334 RepID=UPI003ECE2CD4